MFARQKLIKVVHIPNHPPLQISVTFDYDDDDSETPYMVFKGVVPIGFEVWECVDGEVKYDSSTTQFWGWFLLYPGFSFSGSKESLPGGAIVCSDNGHILQIDGGRKLDLNNLHLQIEMLQMAVEFGRKFSVEEDSDS